MKRCLSILVNKVFKNDLELLYGTGSYVDIIQIKYCTTNRKFLVDCKLYLSNIEYMKESQIDGVEYILIESWKFTGFPEEMLGLLITFDLIDSLSN